jgi:hypothetical protein
MLEPLGIATRLKEGRAAIEQQGFVPHRLK